MKLFLKKLAVKYQQLAFTFLFFRKRKIYFSHHHSYKFTSNKFLDSIPLKFSLFFPQNISNIDLSIRCSSILSFDYSLSEYKYNEILDRNFISLSFRKNTSRNNNVRLIIMVESIKTMALSRETEKRTDRLDDGESVLYTLSV